jgi:hypothetical protein
MLRIESGPTIIWGGSKCVRVLVRLHLHAGGLPADTCPSRILLLGGREVYGPIYLGGGLETDSIRNIPWRIVGRHPHRIVGIHPAGEPMGHPLD